MSVRANAKKTVPTPTGPTRRRRAVRPTADRSPLPPAIPRPVKRTSGPTGGVAAPAHIRVIGTTLGPRDRDVIARKLGTHLGKFAGSVQRTTVRVFDVNGPRGGRDQAAQIKVVLSGQPSVVVEERAVTVQRALARAIKAAALAVKRSVGRRRMKPRRRPATQRRAGSTS